MQMGCRNGDILAHAAIHMNAKHLEKRTAVGLTAQAGRTATAVQIGPDRTPVPYLQIVHVVAQRNDLNAELVSEHSRIGEERLITVKCVVVGATYAHLSNANQGFGGGGLWQFRSGECAKRTRSSED